MNDSIPALGKVLQGAGNAPQAARRASDPQAGGAFASLLATGDAGVAPRPAATTATAAGKSLPERRTKAAADKPVRDRAGADSALAPAPVAAGAPADTQSGAAAGQEPDRMQPVAADPARTPVQGDVPAAAAAQQGAPTGTQPGAVAQDPDRPPPVAAAAATTAHGQDPPAGAATATPQGATVAAQVSAVPQPAGQAQAEQTVDTRQPDAGDASADTTTTQAGKVAQAVHSSVMKLLQGQGGQGHAGAAGHGLSLHAPVADAAAAQKPGADALFAHALATTTGSVPVAQVPVAVSHAGWGHAVGEQVLWFVSQHVRMASLRLNPQHLGPLELQLHMDGDKASIAFTSQHAMVRDALESSLPRLREMFHAQGLDLVNVNVSQQGDSGPGAGHPGNALPAAGASAGAGSLADESIPVPTTSRSAPGSGLVDYYA